MTQETQAQSETVRAIWNQDRTLKIVLGEDIDQEETSCRFTDCDAWAWPKFAGPIVVSGDGVAHFCEDCVREIDSDFVDAYEQAFHPGLPLATARGEKVPYLDGWMERLAAHFPPDQCFIERGPCPVDR